MYVLLVIIHLITAFVMVGAILLQSGKGAEIGATFGGSSQTIFGGRGAATFLSKFTWCCVVVFMLTSLGLAILSKERSLGSSLKLPTPPPVSIPAAPATSSSAPAAPGTPAQSGAQAPVPANAPTAAASSAATPPVQTPASSSAAAPAAGGAPAAQAPAAPAPPAAPAKP